MKLLFDTCAIAVNKNKRANLNTCLTHASHLTDPVPVHKHIRVHGGQVVVAQVAVGSVKDPGRDSHQRVLAGGRVDAVGGASTVT